jgi:hypothetical protein
MDYTLVFTADDLGLDEKTNLAIERAHREGAVTGASLMMGQPGTEHAIEVIRRNPALHIGWHFHACDSRPLTCTEWPWKRSPAIAGLSAAFSPSARRLIRRELSEQWKHFQATGVTCQFINGHHHIHIHPFIAREMCAVVAGSFDGWVRGFRTKFFGANPDGNMGQRILRRWSSGWLKVWPVERQSQSLWGLDRTFRMNAAEVAAVLPGLSSGAHEFIFHPRAENDADQRALIELRTRLGLRFNSPKNEQDALSVAAKF